MKIEKIEIWTQTFELEETYSISYQTTSRVEVVFIRLGSSSFSGIGIGSPDENVTGETPSSLRKSLEQLELLGKDATELPWLLDAELGPSAKAALDMALFDLNSKKLSLPLWKFLGGRPRALATSITIGILPLAETLDRTRAWVQKGFRVLKLKGGVDWEEDLEKLERMRSLVGNAIHLRFDANQGYSIETTRKVVNAISKLQIEFVEQPIAKRAPLDPLEEFPVPLMADESLLGLQDAISNPFQLWNLKLMKTGGIFHGRSILELARCRGIKVMIGCMDEPALGISAGLAFALSSPSVHWIDLDGHIGLKGDPFPDAIHLKEGILIPSQLPGLGTI